MFISGALKDDIENGGGVWQERSGFPVNHAASDHSISLAIKLIAHPPDGSDGQRFAHVAQDPLSQATDDDFKAMLVEIFGEFPDCGCQRDEGPPVSG